MRKLTITITLILFICAGFLRDLYTQPQQTRLIPFKLKDQFGREFEERDLQHWLLVLTGFDRSGSKYAESWMQAIQDSLKDHEEFYKVLLVAVADLRGIPFFLKGFVRGKFPKKRSRWVLMDWKGNFSKAFSFQPKVTNILIFDCESTLVHQTLGREVDQTTLDEIVAKILSVMPECE
jgi:hypothetical protein